MAKENNSIKNIYNKKMTIVIFLSAVLFASVLSVVVFMNTESPETLPESPETLPESPETLPESPETLLETSSSMDYYIETLSKTHPFKVQTDPYFELHMTKSDYDRFNNGLRQLDGVRLTLNPSNADQLIDELKPNTDVVVIFPIFTAAAYYPDGFYNYYSGSCDESCITNVSFKKFNFDYNESGITAQILYHVGYDFLTDAQVDKNPELLDNYETVILLHNEYVTKKEFNAISSHPNLIFLHPNALYAEIDVNHDENVMTLIRGHGYPPDNPIGNGFDYDIEKKFHKYENNSSCKDWKFIKIKNGFHLNCYPESVIIDQFEILKKMKEL